VPGPYGDSKTAIRSILMLCRPLVPPLHCQISAAMLSWYYRGKVYIGLVQKSQLLFIGDVASGPRPRRPCVRLGNCYTALRAINLGLGRHACIARWLNIDIQYIYTDGEIGSLTTGLKVFGNTGRTDQS